MKILIAEDDRTTAQLLSSRLKQAGHQTIVAFDTMQTLMSCRRDRPDVVVLDLHMPGGSGLVVLHRLKSSNATVTIPVIVLTAHSENEAAALEAGADAFLLKPPDFEQLTSVIQRFNRHVEHPSHSLKLVRAPGPARLAPAAANALLRNVLVVDDDRVTANLIGYHLQRDGFATIFATDVPDALRVVSTFRIDAVVLDLELPSGSGLDIIQRLKSSSRTGEIPIFICSGSADEHAADFALAAGADQFFPKPPDMEALVAAIQQWFATPRSDPKNSPPLPLGGVR